MVRWCEPAAADPSTCLPLPPSRAECWTVGAVAWWRWCCTGGVELRCVSSLTLRPVILPTLRYATSQHSTASTSGPLQQLSSSTPMVGWLVSWLVVLSAASLAAATSTGTTQHALSDNDGIDRATR